MKFPAVSDDNRKLQVNWDRVNLYISRWKPKTYFTVEITRKQSKKSDPMRCYYFSTVLPPFMEHLGYETHELELFHRQLKIVYFNIKPDAKGIHRNVPSVFGNESDIPVPDKGKFVDWVVRQAGKSGVYIPDPGEG